jgi:hypothetical protein
MTKIILTILLSFLLACPLWAGQGMGPGPGVGVTAAAPAGEYFGATSPSGSDFDILNQITEGNAATACPGTGTRAVTEITGYLKSAGGTAGNTRLAILDSSYNLVCEGSAAVSVSSTSAGWVGHVGAANITPNPCNITGGTTYILASSGSSTDVLINYVASGSGWYKIADYTTGYANPIDSPTGQTATFYIRAYVE